MISIHIPTGSKSPDLKRELMSARRIKDKKVRDSNITGLGKIMYYI